MATETMNPDRLHPEGVGELAERINALAKAQNHPDVSIRCWRPGVWDTPDGPVVGAAYRCDYRAEEEYGVGDLRRALRGEDPRNVDPLPAAADLVRAFSDVCGVVVATRPLPETVEWGDGRLGYSRGDHAAHFDHSLPYAQGADTSLGWKSMAELRSLAAADDLPRPWARTKAALATQLAVHRGVENPDQWPGWFYDGRHLVLRADHGIAAEVMEHLSAAARRNTLTLAPDSGPFHTGVFLCDASNIGAATRAELVKRWDTHDAQMATIDGVPEALRAGGVRVWFLGNPWVDPERGLVFFINCSPPQGKQVSGWFTGAELTVEHLNAEGLARAKVTAATAAERAANRR